MYEYKFYFKIYLSFLFVLTVYYVTAMHDETSNSMAEWVINYQGGFTRRGFLGELMFQLSLFFDIELRRVFGTLQIVIYLLYFYFIYQFFKNIKSNFIFSLAIFSPIFFLFSLAELEALGRKDILLFLVFLINFIIYEKFRNINFNYIYFLLTFPIVFLTHEIYIIYIPYLLIFFLLIEKKINFSVCIKIIGLVFYVTFFIFLINNVDFSVDNLNLLCKNLLEKTGESCGLAPHSMVVNLGDYRSEVGWQPIHIFRYIMFFLVGSGALISLIFYSEFNKNKNNFIFNKLSYRFIFLLLMIPSILPFLTAVDSGRYLSMAYTFPCIFFFSCYKFNLININFNKMKINHKSLIPKNKKILILIFIIICFTWSPKAVYHEDTASIPIYRLITKIPHFFINFKK